MSVYVSQILFLLNFMDCIAIHCTDPVDMRILATRGDSMYRIHILKCPEVSLFVLGATASIGPGPPHSRDF